MTLPPLTTRQQMIVLLLLAAYRENRPLEVLRLINLLSQSMPSPQVHAAFCP